MASAAEALVIAVRANLPAPVDVRDALVGQGFDVEWQPFGPDVDELNAYVGPRGDPNADSFLSISTQPLADAERGDLARRATEQLGEGGASSIRGADALVRVSVTPGSELDWRRAFETVLGAVGSAPGAVVYLVNEDEYLDAAEVSRRMEREA